MSVCVWMIFHTTHTYIFIMGPFRNTLKNRRKKNRNACLTRKLSNFVWVFYFIIIWENASLIMLISVCVRYAAILSPKMKYKNVSKFVVCTSHTNVWLMTVWLAVVWHLKIFPLKIFLLLTQRVVNTQNLIFFFCYRFSPRIKRHAWYLVIFFFT